MRWISRPRKVNVLKPITSILIPCFNSERWIASTIRSALNQTYVNKEVIVVDDGSTDASVKVIKSFGDKIQFESGPNKGGNFARNRLLELSVGKWVQFLDADDYLKPTKIEKQLQSTGKIELVDAVYSPVVCERWDADQVVSVNDIAPNPSHSIEEQWIRWRVAQTGSVLWKRKSLQKIGGWNEDYPCCQDNEVTLRALKNGLQFHYSPLAEAVYRIWSEETVCRKDPSQVIRFKTKLIDEMLDWLKLKGSLTGSHSKAAGQAFFEMARTLAKSDLSAAVEYVTERKSRGPFRVIGPAAPMKYVLAYRSIGFKNAERIATRIRR